ncbi:DUF488 family protein [Paracoccus litorisediminis]|uniref:DUF488 domain-containing protein n=1 Tax=Paracoccus litorisediminis TaxID=2006130 RepID=UPI00372EB7B4
MIYSIGHGSRPWSHISEILLENRCKYLIDVRSNPHSKYNPDFNRSILEELCAKAGIAYVFMGDSLGGRPKGKRFYSDDGRVSYDRVRQSSAYIGAIDRLINASKLTENCAIICSESDPRDCHRSKLIGQSLQEAGIEVHHIDKDASIKGQIQIMDNIDGGQPDLFGASLKASFSRGKYK